MSAVPSGLLATSLLPGAESSGYAIARATGANTQENPLRLMLLLRHAGWTNHATENAPGERITEVATMLEAGLRKIDAALPPTRTSEAMAAVLQDASSRAVKLDTYFSGAVVVGTGRQVVAASIGHVAAWRITRTQLVPLLAPTTVEVGGQLTSVLTGAVGIGFALEKVCHAALAPTASEDLMFLLGGSQISAVTFSSTFTNRAFDVGTRLDQLLTTLAERPPIAAVIRLS